MNVKKEELRNGDVVLVKGVVKKSRGVWRIQFNDGPSVSMDDVEVTDIVSQKFVFGDVVGVIDPANKNAKPQSGTIRSEHLADEDEYLVRFDQGGESKPVKAELLRRLPD